MDKWYDTVVAKYEQKIKEPFFTDEFNTYCDAATFRKYLQIWIVYRSRCNRNSVKKEQEKKITAFKCAPVPTSPWAFPAVVYVSQQASFSRRLRFYCVFLVSLAFTPRPSDSIMYSTERLDLLPADKVYSTLERAGEGDGGWNFWLKYVTIIELITVNLISPLPMVTEIMLHVRTSR